MAPGQRRKPTKLNQSPFPLFPAALRVSQNSSVSGKGKTNFIIVAHVTGKSGGASWTICIIIPGCVLSSEQEHQLTAAKEPDPTWCWRLGRWTPWPQGKSIFSSWSRGRVWGCSRCVHGWHEHEPFPWLSFWKMTYTHKIMSTWGTLLTMLY